MNVVVFALDACPVSAFGPYGNEWVGTPHLDRLAAEGVVFDRHISDSPSPIAARRAWRTGRHKWQPDGPDMLAALAEHSVRTVLVRHARNDPPDSAAGWSEVIDARPDPADPSPADALLAALPAVLDRLAAHAGPWLLWVESDRLTPPWDVPQDVFEAYIEDVPDDEPRPADEEEDDEADESEPEAEEPVTPWADPPTGWFDRDDLASWEYLHTSFAAAVTAFDADLGRVFDLLRYRGLDRSAAWAFTAARGYPLGEHGVIGLHRPWLHEELVHLPLIVRLPDAAECGRRVATLTQPADLAPTLAGWLGAGFPVAENGGADLAPLLNGTAEAVRPHAVSALEQDGIAECAIRTPDWAMLLPARPHPDDDPRPVLLFEKPDDYWEVNDVRSQHPDTAEELERLLREAVGDTHPTPR